MRLTILIVISALLSAQTTIVNIHRRPVAAGGGGIALVTNAHASAFGTTSPSTITTSGVNTTGATLLVVVGNSFSNSGCDTGGGSQQIISDSNGNTWHHLTNVAGSTAQTCISYAFDHGGTALVVGAAHTVTGTGGAFSAIVFAAFSGTKTTSAVFDSGGTNTDAGNNACATGTTCQPGSATPSANGALIITGVCDNTNNSYTIDLSFAITDQINNSSTMAGGMAYLVQGTAAAINPTWTSNNSQSAWSTVIGVFLPQ